MGWRWLAAVEERPPDADVGAAELHTPEGDRAGWLAAWPKGADCPPGGLRVDERAVTADGTDLTWVSLALGVPLPFDDGGVTQALRRRLQLPWPGLVSTLLVDWSKIAGALTAAPSEQALEDDPFARLFPTRLLRIEPGLLGPIPAPTGPAVTRYGSGNPWPWDRYHGQGPD
jgi:hypothetical protein